MNTSGKCLDIKARLADRVQLTDAHKAYLDAVEDSFGGDNAYAQLVKIYGQTRSPAKPDTLRPSAPAGRKSQVSGTPDKAHISPSFVERQNLTMRMTARRFTRLTNAFSKKIVNHEHSVALYVMHYNFVRIHQTLRVTPAIAAGLTDRLWEIDDLVTLLD